MTRGISILISSVNLNFLFIILLLLLIKSYVTQLLNLYLSYKIKEQPDHTFSFPLIIVSVPNSLTLSNPLCHNDFMPFRGGIYGTKYLEVLNFFLILSNPEIDIAQSSLI